MSPSGVSVGHTQDSGWPRGACLSSSRSFLWSRGTSGVSLPAPWDSEAEKAAPIFLVSLPKGHWPPREASRLQAQSREPPWPSGELASGPRASSRTLLPSGAARRAAVGVPHPLGPSEGEDRTSGRTRGVTLGTAFLWLEVPRPPPPPSCSPERCGCHELRGQSPFSPEEVSGCRCCWLSLGCGQ